MLEFKYRPDIDGLRAIAVLLVLLFHANFGFGGGYVGVDVFFVISGYLITGLILKEQQSGTFTLAGFWDRRIRRIIPAATCMVAITLAVGTLLLLPYDLEKLAESTVAQQLMLANVYFRRNTGYFDGAAELKPLMHTWSLAVEEQFYLGFPFLLALCGRLQKRYLALLLSALAAISFAVSEWGSHRYPTAAFFLLPPRAWELLTGSMLVFCPPPTRLKPWLCDVLGGLGLGGIFLASLWYDASTRFPGSTAMLPCLGAALVIYSNSIAPTIVGRVLSTNVLVTLGLMSYSLYLWHWPILAYLRYWFGENLPVPTRVVALLLSMLLAYVSWKCVERPFRKGGSFKHGMTVFYLALSCSVCLIVVSLGVEKSKGLPGRFPVDAVNFTADDSLLKGWTVNTGLVRKGRLPQFGSSNAPETPITFLIWGDSHAAALAELCNSLAKEYGIKGVIAARYATVPLLETWRPTRGKEVVQWNEAVLEYIKSRKISNVILVSNWAINIEGRPNGSMDTLIVDQQSTEVCTSESKAVLKRGLERTIAKLTALGVKVWVIKQVPVQASNTTRSLAAAAYFGRPLPTGVRIEAHRQLQSKVDDVMKSLDSTGVRILDPTDYCFDSSGNSIIGNVESSFYIDDNHISKSGADSLLRPLLEPVFASIAADN